MIRPLKKEEMISVIEGRSFAPRVPVMLHFWTNPSQFADREALARGIMGSYPQDAQFVPFRIPEVYDAPPEAPEYRWVNYGDPHAGSQAAMDDRPAILDWDRLEGILSDFPNPNYAGLFSEKPAPDGRYRVGYWWYGLFERHWQLRGMKNALMDYYTNPDEVHRLFRAVTDFYLAIMERGRKELLLDAVFTSDDLGTQSSLFFSPNIFVEFYKPYYTELIKKAHALGMHFWLHTCGCVRQLISHFIEIGLDVLHPIQKYTMDEKDIAMAFGKDICIWAGFDVQQIIPWGTAEQVREEVRHLMDTYYRPEGKLLFTAGNVINGDCPAESLNALYDEAFRYGLEISERKAPPESLRAG